MPLIALDKGTALPRLDPHARVDCIIVIMRLVAILETKRVNQLDFFISTLEVPSPFTMWAPFDQFAFKRNFIIRELADVFARPRFAIKVPFAVRA